MIYLLLMILFLIYAEVAVASCKEAVSLFLFSVLPTLLPFFIISNLILNSSLPRKMSNSLSRFMFPIFGIPGAGAAALVPGLLCGYPIGAAACVDLYKKGLLSRAEAERLSAFTSNTGPFFVVGAVGAAMCGSAASGHILLATHIIASLIVGFLFRFYKKEPYTYRINDKSINKDKINKKRTSLKETFKSQEDDPFGERIGEAVAKSVKSVASVGGFIIFFAVIIGIIRSTGIFQELGRIVAGENYKIVEGTFSGLVEITTGCNLITKSEINLLEIMPFLALVIGFGGLSVHAQVISILSRGKLRSLPFITGKALQSIIASILTQIAINIEFVQEYINNNLEVSSNIQQLIETFPTSMVYVIFACIFMTMLIYHFRLRLSS